MSESYEMTDPDRFTAGTVGPPGERVFYLQAAEDGQVVTLRLEKQQVAALCEYLAGMLTDLPPAPDEPGLDLELHEPVDPEWLVGSMGVAYEQERDRILLVVEELVTLDEEDLDTLGDPLEEALAAALGDDDEPATARFHLRRPLVAAFIEHGLRLVAGGRPTCDLCGGPVDPAGHSCPRLN